MTSLRTRFFQIALTLVALAGAFESLLVLLRPKLVLDHWGRLQMATADAVSRGGSSWRRRRRASSTCTRARPSAWGR